MKIKSLKSRRVGSYTVLSVMMMMLVFVSSCKKEDSNGLAPAENTANANQKSERLRANVSDVVQYYISNSTNRTSDFSDPAYNYTQYSTPSANVSQWSNPTTGTTFTFAQSTSTTGGGLGQLTYDSKSVDYNYVITIKASSTDPAWSGFLNGRDLIGTVAISTTGDITSPNFILKNFSIFLVSTIGGAGSYKFNDFSSTAINSTFAIGEIIDLSNSQNATLANFQNGGMVYFTSGGHVTVSSSDFTMESDAKVMDVATGNESQLGGMIMFE